MNRLDAIQSERDVLHLHHHAADLAAIGGDVILRVRGVAALVDRRVQNFAARCRIAHSRPPPAKSVHDADKRPIDRERHPARGSSPLSP